jgi:hypothetical protein
MKIHRAHSFHIPVMGVGFTIDTPLKTAAYGISSVISIGDDGLMEKLRAFYCHKFGIPYQPIPVSQYDSKAKRTTAYLNLIGHIASMRFEELKQSGMEEGSPLKKYLEMMPDYSTLKTGYLKRLAAEGEAEAVRWLRENLVMGEIDVNVMTKVDRVNYLKHKPLPSQFNDGHASLRGFAESELNSSLILSSGMNPRLYSYLEQFPDFYPDASGAFRKKIILKVSDYRSALIQGKFLAKKGLWISEFRIESGLNCGGHAFPADGLLLGPVLEEFASRKEELAQSLFDLFSEGLASKELPSPSLPPPIRITVQGGVGTAAEHLFLLDHYSADSVGWGTPFLLVPEVVNADADTLDLLKSAREEDLYLSDISPLGVRFNSIRGNSKDVEKERSLEKGKAGSPCPKRFLALNTEYDEEGLCTASHKYQALKIKDLEAKDLSPEMHEREYAKIVGKACICTGLGATALLVNNLPAGSHGKGVSVCPGPNMAYFSEEATLQEMVGHIYGRLNLIKREDRPNLFIKELDLNFRYLKEKLAEISASVTERELRSLEKFQENLAEGIKYYKNLFQRVKSRLDDKWEAALIALDTFSIDLEHIRFSYMQEVAACERERQFKN